MNQTGTEIGIAGSTARSANDDRDKSGLIFWEWKGRMFVSGLFKMHDTHGFPLSESLIFCKQRSLTPCTEQFVADAIRAGWTEDRARKTVDEAIRECDSFVMEKP